MAPVRNFKIGTNGPPRDSAAMVSQQSNDVEEAIRTNPFPVNRVGSFPVTKRGFKMPKKNLIWKKLDKFKKNLTSPAETKRNFETILNRKNNLMEIENFVIGERAETKRMREDFEELKTAYEDYEENEFKLAVKKHKRALGKVAIQSEMERILFQAVFLPGPSNNDD